MKAHGPIRVLGVTGSIGMGKSTAMAMLARMGVPVFSADACVHDLLGPGGGAVVAVAAAFPGTGSDGAIERAALGRAVFGKPDALVRLEGDSASPGARRRARLHPAPDASRAGRCARSTSRSCSRPARKPCATPWWC